LVVRDTTAPTLIDCPADMTITANSDCEAVVTWTEPTAIDNCSDAIIIVSSSHPLTFDNFPGSIVSNETPEGSCGVVLGWIEPTVSGGCNSTSNDSITVTSTHQPSDFFPVGVTTVTYTATNHTTGQVVERSFNVTVNRSLDPLSLCPQDISIQADGTVMNDPLSFINDVRSDTCGRYVVTFNNIQVTNDCGVQVI